MKKLLSIFLVACTILLLNTSAAFAQWTPADMIMTHGIGGNGVGNGDEEPIQKVKIFNPRQLLDVKSIAVAPAMYTARAGNPSWQEVMLVADNVATSVAKKSDVIIYSYSYIAERILHEEGIDLGSLSRSEATKVFKKYAPKYVDAYAMITITNGSKDCILFVDVYQSATNRGLYQYREGVNSKVKNATEYNDALKGFFSSIGDVKKDAKDQKEEETKKKTDTIEWNMND